MAGHWAEVWHLTLADGREGIPLVQAFGAAPAGGIAVSNHMVSRLAEVMDLAAWSSRCPVQDAPIFQGVTQAAIGRCGHTQMRAGQCPGRWQERERCVLALVGHHTGPKQQHRQMEAQWGLKVVLFTVGGHRGRSPGSTVCPCPFRQRLLFKTCI